MKNLIKTKYIIILIIIALGSFGTAATYGFVKYYKQQQTELLKTADALQKQQEALKIAQQQIDSIKSDNSKNSSQSDQTTQKIKTLEQQLSNSKKSTPAAPSPQTTLSTADIVAQWTPNIALIACDFSVDDPSMKQSMDSSGIDTRPYTAFGSGFLRTIADSKNLNKEIVSVITNQHVFWGYNGFVLANSCKVLLPGNHQYSISRDNMFDTGNGDFKATFQNEVINGQPYSIPNVDSGYFSISNPDTYTRQIASTQNICSAQPRIGDSILILGYPGIGSENSITATEGIVSGIEDKFFVTSAKVEHGNSGGAAILKDKNCYLGIPTFVKTGELESLARILDFNQIFNK